MLDRHHGTVSAAILVPPQREVRS